MPESSLSGVTRLSLLSRIRSDDGVALAELVELYLPLVKFWCRRQGIAENDLSDLTQEIFFAVSRSIERYRPTGNGGSFRAWLWSLSRHKIIDFLRRQERCPVAKGGSTAMQLVQMIPEEIDESDLSERIEFNQLIHRALQQVRTEFEPRSWQAFWRTTIDGLTVSNVADQLEMSSATVRQHRSRILRRLREQLGEAE
ncbi:sigma-70 family RNA polymerase sigma factor [Roseiconus lacunae]|uniref:sigma-70 family RNA polymerase sigma factor n=1 Tax=Roseiconus lacunae TaxID=2605694 RepID=UPI00308B2210|nr:sigma-70 family RNA polymerase sigma factor [Stieleria sp. HD01]